MAITYCNNCNKTTSEHTVAKDETLWGIAESHLGSGLQYTTLAAINKLPNPDLIYVGQTIKLTGTSSSDNKRNNTQTQIVKRQFGFQSDIDNVLFITWSFNRAGVSEYEVQWYYYTNNFEWFGGISTTTTTKDKFATYNVPSNATKVKCRVKPVPGEKQKWKGVWSPFYETPIKNKPPVPTGLTVSLTGLDLKAEVSNLKGEPSVVRFEVIKDNATAIKRESVGVKTGVASYSCKVAPGGIYKVRCQACKNEIWSDWTDYSSNYESSPAAPKGFTKCEPGIDPGTREAAITLAWDAVTTAATYDIQYTATKSYFEVAPDKVLSKEKIETNTCLLIDNSNITSGNTYFLRIRSVNKSGEASDWSEISECTISEEPAPPTTWSSSTDAFVGEPLWFYWTHNSQDGSSLKYSQVTAYKVLQDGTTELAFDITLTNKDGDEETNSGSYFVDTSIYPDGTRLIWTVQTAGIGEIYSDYSVQKTIDIYARPTLKLEVTDLADSVIDSLTSFPFKVYAVSEPSTQAPIYYHLEIVANTPYGTVDAVGEVKTISPGDQVYSKHFDIVTELEHIISAGDVHLENGAKYTIICTVSLNSGLTATASKTFIVSWETTVCSPDAIVTINEDALSASITPFCEVHDVIFCKATKLGTYYQIDTSDTYDSVSRAYEYMEAYKKSRIIDPVGKTIDGQVVYAGVTSDGKNVEYCEVAKVTPVTNVYLAVYRREFDGTFTEIYSGLDGAKNETIVDPHPSLDYARYRIVATDKDTGSVNYYDMPGIPIGGKTIVLQWDEVWSKFDTQGIDDDLVDPPWVGSLLKLPYNIDVSNSHSSDASLIEYAGRKHPVSYYGTQVGETATWNAVIEKSDIDTLYALRRLAVWMGDVYVREPSGSGYWANISVSFSQKHKDMTIPVTLSVTRVEGGI